MCLILKDLHYITLQLIPRHVETLQWRHNERDGVSNHRCLDCLLSRLFRHRSKKTSKPRATGLCEGNSPVTGEFPAQSVSKADLFNVEIRWHRRVIVKPPHARSWGYDACFTCYARESAVTRVDNFCLFTVGASFTKRDSLNRHLYRPGYITTSTSKVERHYSSMS